MSPTVKCSFCGNSQHEARKIIMGPGVFICDRCVGASLEILQAEGIVPGCPTCKGAGREGAETQFSIGEWAAQTFGQTRSLASIAARGNVEMAELLRAAVAGMPGAQVVGEAADVAIVLYRLSHVAGHALNDAIQAKMKVNRERKWLLDGQGHGQHKRTP